MIPCKACNGTGGDRGKLETAEVGRKRKLSLSTYWIMGECPIRARRERKSSALRSTRGWKISHITNKSSLS